MENMQAAEKDKENMDNIAENALEGRNLRLRVLTPLKVICDKQVSMIVVRTINGDMGVLYGHDTRSALLSNGILRVFINNKERKDESLIVLGGMITINDNEAVVMSEIAEHPDNLQAFIDKLDADRAANRLAAQSTDLHTRRMETAIRQALVQMDVSAYTILKNHGEYQSD